MEPNEILVVRLPLPERFQHNPELVVRSLLIEHQAKFWSYFSRLVDPYDARYSIVNDSLEIEALSVGEAGGTVSGTVVSSFYAGCRDQNGVDTHNFDFGFEIIGRELVFDLKLAIDWRQED